MIFMLSATIPSPRNQVEHMAGISKGRWTKHTHCSKPENQRGLVDEMAEVEQRIIKCWERKPRAEMAKSDLWTETPEVTISIPLKTTLNPFR